MARFTFVAVALAVAGAQWARRDWNSACANPQCTRQGKVAGPQDVNAAVWTQAQTALNIISEYGIVVEGGGARIALAQEVSCPEGGLCAATAVYNASGVPIYERVYDDVPLYTATYIFGVPAVAAYSSTGETGEIRVQRCLSLPCVPYRSQMIPPLWSALPLSSALQSS